MGRGLRDKGEDYVRSEGKAATAVSTMRKAVGLLLALLAVSGIGASFASAAPLVEFSQFGGEAGGAGGQIKQGQGVAVNRSGAGAAAVGDVYVAEGGFQGNNRIQQFKADGTFVRAWGFDVIQSGKPGDLGTTVFEVCTVATDCKAGTTATVGGFNPGGQMSSPQGIAIDQSTGAVYVSEQNFLRVQRFSATGSFERAWGQDVVQTGKSGDSPATSAKQNLKVEATGGQFKLSFKGQTTGDIAYNAAAASVQTELRALSTIGTSNVTVSGGPGNELGTTPYVITFAGALANSPQPLITTSAGTTPLSGGAATAAVTNNTTGSSGFEVCTAAADCKTGVTGATAGAFASTFNGQLAVAPVGSPSAGRVIVADPGNRRVQEFSSAGAFVDAFGWDVVSIGSGDSATDETQSVTVKATGGTFTLTFNGQTATAIPFNATTAALEGKLNALSSIGGAGGSVTVTGGPGDNTGTSPYLITFHGSLGGDDIAQMTSSATGLTGGSPATVATVATTAQGGAFEVCKASAFDVCKTAGATGAGNGQLDQIKGVAVDSSGAIYATSVSSECTVTRPCRVHKFGPDGTFKEIFGPSFGGEDACQIQWNNGAFANANPVSGRPPAQIAYGIAVSPVDQHVFVIRKTGGSQSDICEFDPSGAKVARSPENPLPASVSTNRLSIATGTEERVYVQSPNPSDTAWPVRIMGTVPAPGAEVTEATDVTGSSATLNGVVTTPSPGGTGFDVVYHFEYSGDNGFTWTSVPAEDVSVGSTAAGPHPVQQEVSGLLPNFTYRVRLVATTSFTTTSSVVSFNTLQVAPTIVDQRPTAKKTSADLEAKINPNGLTTNIYFEWGAGTSYSNRIPADHELSAGDSWDPVRFSVTAGGLEEGTVYHFRVVASNSKGTTVGPDQRFETLNEHGLVDERGIELVSPVDKGVQGAVGSKFLFPFQSAENGESVLFPILGGLADSVSGGDTAYLARRSDSGWLSTEVSPPSLVPATTPGVLGEPFAGKLVNYAPDLSCGIVYSVNPLTDDTPRADVELGTYNLYIRHADGSYRLITDRAPANPEQLGVEITSGVTTLLAGASQDCKRVYFESAYDYLPGPSGERFLYEWDDGVLRDASVVPPEGKPGIPVGTSDPRFLAIHRQADVKVSSDGSRLAFSARSQDPATPGRDAVFVRKDGVPIEVSKRQGGSVDSLGSRFEMLAPDGGHVFFLATYGLTAESSSGPTESCASVDASDNRACDLYDYDVDTGVLTNLSATSASGNTRGAVVKSLLAVSDDGASAYFGARAQLTPGEGKTYAQNVDAKSANLYLARGGQLFYVATVGDDAAAIPLTGPASVHVTPDGDHLLFQTAANVTGYDSGGVRELYLYDADSGKTICISCRPDGEPSVDSPLEGALTSPRSGTGRVRTMSDDGSRVFFVREDPLAPGAVGGNRNVYEWQEGQTSLLTTGSVAALYGVSASGDDVFVRTAEQLTPYDKDRVPDLYDFRVGGGFPPPSAEPPACQVDDSVSLEPNQIYCQGSPSAQPGATSPGSVVAAGRNVRGSHCTRFARRARGLSIRAKRLGRHARLVNRRNHRRAVRMSRKARRLGKRAGGLSERARRCRGVGRGAGR